MGALRWLAARCWWFVRKVLKFLTDQAVPPGTNFTGLVIGLAALFAVFAPLHHGTMPRPVEALMGSLVGLVLLGMDVLWRKVWLDAPLREALFEYERGPRVIGLPGWMWGTLAIVLGFVHALIEMFKG